MPLATKTRTKADAKAFIDQAFRDAISWKAARILLERVQSEGVGSDDLRAAIARFLAAHPVGR